VVVYVEMRKEVRKLILSVVGLEFSELTCLILGSSPEALPEQQKLWGRGNY